MAMKINPEECTACGDCAAACPNHAITGKGAYFVVDADACNECEADVSQACADICPANCIDYA